MYGMQENRKKQKKNLPALSSVSTRQSWAFYPALPSAGLTLGKVTIPLSSVNTREIFF
jgi:hypothetical protein